MAASVKLPAGEDRNEWFACNVVDFFNEINLVVIFLSWDFFFFFNTPLPVNYEMNQDFIICSIFYLTACSMAQFKKTAQS